MPRRNFVFIVQGEGRGHMMQALALRHLLRRAGHQVASVLVGRSAHRTIPSFFLDKIQAPVVRFDSPNFVAGRDQRRVRLGPTLLYNARKAGRYQAALDVIDQQVKAHRPEVIVNFFEPLGGLYKHLRRPAAPMVCIGHQYMFLHPAYRFPAGHTMQRHMLKQFTRLTALGAARRLALSLYPAPGLPEVQLDVMPPLLREAVFAAPPARPEPFFLVYLLNRGYADEVVRWHEQHPAVRLHCFWDAPGAPPTSAYDGTLTFHRLSDEKFLDRMRRCQGLACTAGFEAVAEARYLGKPVLLVPTAGHFEQLCNAGDAVRSRAGLQGASFNLDPLLKAKGRSPAAPAFRRWVEQAGDRFVAALEEALAPAGLLAVPGYRRPETARPAAPAAALHEGVLP